MSPYVPDGEPWPADGRLDPKVTGEPSKNLALYIHVPFCTVRCGYCDFNTYTVGFGEGADLATYDRSVMGELQLASSRLAPFGHEPVKSIFFGGGTPTMLNPSQIGGILRSVRDNFDLDPGAEITLEANPDTVDESSLEALAEAGITRVSFGMQSGVSHVLRTLDRTHNPEQVPRVVSWARKAGMDASVDLIYGTPGESLADWRVSLESALSMQPDHISTYALVIEEGTKMWQMVRRGELEMPDPDDEAQKYELANELLEGAGFAWYEISNWARLEPGESAGTTSLRHASKHNLAYWFDWDWWGVGPGAHSHVGNLRWWNRKHPRAWADALRGTHAFAANPDQSAAPAVAPETSNALGAPAKSGSEALYSPAHAGEILSGEDRALETVLLKIRTADGISVDELDPSVRGRIASLVDEGVIDGQAAKDGSIKLTLRGRLLADYVTRELTV
ncbi:MAG: radical SAM family heme chaperone HemW [Actinomycetaceae bacterium]|nr:radical SAM family heme chaperone HemW [Actinomycetaceae bacterium]